jgi:hypothetical protein
MQDSEIRDDTNVLRSVALPSKPEKNQITFRSFPRRNLIRDLL